MAVVFGVAQIVLRTHTRTHTARMQARMHACVHPGAQAGTQARRGAEACRGIKPIAHNARAADCAYYLAIHVSNYVALAAKGESDPTSGTKIQRNKG